MAGGEEYKIAAEERRRDAARLRDASRDLAAIYILGYAVECGLKALLEVQNRPVPRGGPAGHNLSALWESAGFKRLETEGYRRLFFNEWDVAIRYQGFLPPSSDPVALYRGGCELASNVQKQYNRARSRRNKK